MQLVFILLGILVFLGLMYVGAVWAVLAFSLRPIRVFQFISPGMLGYPQEEVQMTTSDGVKIVGWWTPGESDLVFISVHGYIMNRCEWVPTLSFLGERGISTLHIDLRGHGRSGAGKITFGKNESLDVEAAIEWVRAKVPGKKIVLMGSSMGGVASVLAATRHADVVSGLILDGTLRNLDEGMRGWWPFLGGKPLAMAMSPSIYIAPIILGFQPSTVDVDKALAKLSEIPVLLLYGGSDPLITRESIEQMKVATGANGRLVMFDGATHGAGRLNDPMRFKKEVLGFLKDYELID